MSTIRIHIDDLCAFFTKYPDRLVVGMIPTDDAPPEHRHAPHIVIRQAGVVLREYQGFDTVNGDISLRVFPQGAPLARLAAMSADERRKPFALLVDIENVLYPRRAADRRARALPRALLFCARYALRHETYALKEFTENRFQSNWTPLQPLRTSY